MEERVIREGIVHREEVAIKGKNSKIASIDKKTGKRIKERYVKNINRERGVHKEQTSRTVLLQNGGSWNACTIKRCITLLCMPKQST
jgi:hypothetical protein